MYDVSVAGEDALLIDAHPRLGHELSMWGSMNEDLLTGHQNIRMKGHGFLEVVEVIEPGMECITKYGEGYNWEFLRRKSTSRFGGENCWTIPRGERQNIK